MAHTTTTLMHPDDVMRRYRPAIHGTWGNVIEKFAADPVEAERVEILGRELRDGPFARPIVVQEGRRFAGLLRDSCVIDGHHRLLAAHAAGEPLAVSTGDPDGDEPMDFWTTVVDVRWHEDDHRFNPFVSLPLADGTWAESAGAAIPYTDGCYEVRYGLRPGTPAELLRRAMSAFLARHGWNPEVERLYPSPEDDLLR